MKLIIVVFLLVSAIVFAQNDSINLLDEVKLHGNFSSKINAGFHIKTWTDSIITKKQQSLTQFLQNQTNAYFKQHGNGMVSSIALRGSNASQTAVYWNGIAINSTLNGQTDFNTLSPTGYNKIEIRKGAGSTLFGSGAIGGAINLSDEIRFVPKKKIRFNGEIGNYNTQKVAYQLERSTKKLFAKVSFAQMQSDNDYPFLNTNLFNENGAYNNQHLKTTLGYKLSNNTIFNFYMSLDENEREFSRTLTAPSNSKYINTDSKFSLQWKNTGKKHHATLNLATVNELYHYHFNKEDSHFSFGKSTTYFAKYDFSYSINKNSSLRTGIENRYTAGNGSNITPKNRNTVESYLLFQQELIKKLNYNLSIRKGYATSFDIPFIYALGIKYDLNSKLSLNGNYSTNYKLPTFNDLYWNFSGNENLKPERNKSAEIGLHFKHKNNRLNLTTYYTNSDDLIQWRPETVTFWRPINVQKARGYGLEFGYKTNVEFNKHRIGLQAQYDYNISKDDTLDKQLIYIPKHKAVGTLNYNYKTWDVQYNQHYNGNVFTTTSNTQIVDAYWLSNFTVTKRFSDGIINLSVQANNLFNTSYQTVAYRPMPNRNLNLNINIQI